MTDLKQKVKDFAEVHIKPFSRKWDAENHFPREVVLQLGELGVLSILIPNLDKPELRIERGWDIPTCR